MDAHPTMQGLRIGMQNINKQNDKKENLAKAATTRIVVGVEIVKK